MISIEQITCFAKVYELQSYSAASNQLGKSRSTIRERINALEDIMGVELFSIEGKKAVPSDLAHRLYPRARLLARQSLEFEHIAMSAHQEALTRINVFHDSSVPIKLLTAIDATVKQNLPDIRINWLQRNRAESLKEIEDCNDFIALMPGAGNVHPLDGVGSINLGTYKLGIFTSVYSKLPQKPLSITELSTELQLLTDTDLANELRHAKVSCDIEIVSCRKLLIEKLKVSGWYVASVEEMKPYVDNGELRQIEMIEAPKFVRQDCVLFYSLSSLASMSESKIIETISNLAKDYLLS